MEISGPRLRSLLRQAEKIANSGKIAAAATLYRQVTKEAPQVVTGWLGLAAVTTDKAEKEQAIEQVLTLDPENQHAQYLLAQLKDRPLPAGSEGHPLVPASPSIMKKRPEPDKETAVPQQPATSEPDEADDTTAVSETAEPIEADPAGARELEEEFAVPEEEADEYDDYEDEEEEDEDEVYEVGDTDEDEDRLETDWSAEMASFFEENNGGLPLDSEAGPSMVCYRHRNRETSLRCYSCDRYICSKCAVKTPVGYRCPICIREAEDVFFNATFLDYLIAPIISLPLSLVAGFLVLSLSGGFLFILIIFFLAGVIGGFIGQASKWAVGRRRGRYLAHIVAAIVAMGIIIPGLPLAVNVLFGNASFFALLGPAVYLFIAVSAAFYRMK